MEKKVYFSRQSDIIETDRLKCGVTIVGLGSIGSWVALALSKLGIEEIVLIDFDKVGEENLASQFYKHLDTSSLKAIVLSRHIGDFGAVKNIVSVVTSFEKVETEHYKEILICALDSLEARRTLFKWVEVHLPQVQLLIDGRMAREYMRIFTVPLLQREAVDRYKKSLYSNRQPEDVPCSERAVVYNVFCCAGLIASLVKKYLMKEDLPKELILDLKSNVLTRMG